MQETCSIGIIHFQIQMVKIQSRAILINPHPIKARVHTSIFLTQPATESKRSDLAREMPPALQHQPEQEARACSRHTNASDDRLLSQKEEGGKKKKKKKKDCLGVEMSRCPMEGAFRWALYYH